MIAGIGVDVVDLARFERSMTRTPRLGERLFTTAELALPLTSLAGRFAAKEALIKALGGSTGVRWLDIEIDAANRLDPDRGAPSFTLSGTTAERVRALSITALHLSMSHDAGIATAFVIAERSAAETVTA